MKKLAVLLTIFVFGCGLYLSLPSTRVRFSFYSATAIAYSQDREIQGKIGELPLEKFDSVTISLTQTQLDKFLEIVNPTHLSSYVVEGVTVTDGFSPSLVRTVTANNSTERNPVNFQIAVRGERILVGLPVIVGGY